MFIYIAHVYVENMLARMYIHVHVHVKCTNMLMYIHSSCSFTSCEHFHIHVHEYALEHVCFSLQSYIFYIKTQAVRIIGSEIKLIFSFLVLKKKANRMPSQVQKI